MQLAIHTEGLVVRFGRIVPDSLLILQCMVEIRERVARRGLELTSFAIRLEPAAPGESGRGWVRLSQKLAKEELDGYFEPLDEQVLVVESISELRRLIPVEDGSQLVFLSASRRRVAEALDAGLKAFHVRESGTPGEAWISYGEIPRMIEESLRIPTARPMSPGARTGGLLAISVKDGAEVRSRVLEAIRSDGAADWVTLGRHLILYTENPDLEDSLASRPEVTHLSYSVHKARLAIGPAPLSGETVIFRDGAIALRETGPDMDSVLLGWNEIRRGNWPRSQPSVVGAARTFGTRAKHLGILPEDKLAFEKAMEDDSAQRMVGLFEALTNLLQVDLAADLVLSPDRTDSGVLSWSSPFGSGEAEQLVVVVHRVMLVGRPGGASAFELAAALAVWRWIEAAKPAPGVVHGVIIDPYLPVEDFCELILRSEEIQRVSAIIELCELDQLDSGSGHLEAVADERLREIFESSSKVDIRGGVSWLFTGEGAIESELPLQLQISGSLKPKSPSPSRPLDGLGAVLSELFGALPEF